MTPTFDDFDRDEQAWSDYCDEQMERDALAREDAEEAWEAVNGDWDEVAEGWRESALTAGERNR